MPAPKNPDQAALRALDRAITKARAELAKVAERTPAHVAAVQDAIARLRDLERDVAIDLGKNLGAAQGELPDGRLFTLKRAADRTAWDHDEWKRDARRVIAKDLSDRFTDTDSGDLAVLDQATGEVVTLGRVLQEAMTAIENVHGSAAPKSTALKPLGLYASDYCTSTPGGWTFRATPKPTTTIQEN